MTHSYGLFSKVNPIELKRVLSNLINNSIEAIKNNDGLIQVKVERDVKHVVILVRDNGNGIPIHVLEKLRKCEGTTYLS